MIHNLHIALFDLIREASAYATCEVIDTNGDTSEDLHEMCCAMIAYLAIQNETIARDNKSSRGDIEEIADSVSRSVQEKIAMLMSSGRYDLPHWKR